MEHAKDRLLQWLRDAHAMEEQAITMLDSQVQRLEHYPELRGKLQQHLEETRAQLRTVEGCIERCGGSPSASKDFAAKTTAFFQGMSGIFTTDEVVKGAMAAYTFEHFDVSAYRSLIGAAKAAGATELVPELERLLNEEQAMADWLGEHLPTVTEQFLARESSREPAKH